MRERTIYCVDCGGPTSEVVSSISMAGWTCLPIDCSELQHVEFATEEVALGILVLGKDSHFDASAIGDALARAGDVSWIAHLPLSMARSDFGPALAARMSDYVTPPHHSESLARSLHRLWAMRVMLDLLEDNAEQSVPALLGLEGTRREELNIGIARAAKRSQCPMLVYGNEGAGREFVARAVHQRSPLKDQPFTALNCASLPHALMDSLLLGGSQQDNWQGLIPAAAGGSLYLESPDDLPPALQVRLVKLLDDGNESGGDEARASEVPARILLGLRPGCEAGPLQNAVEATGKALRIQLPALEGRAEDIETLCQAYLKRFIADQGLESPGFSHQAIQRVTSYEWAGNVRELVGRVGQALTRAESRLIFPSDLGLDRRSPARRIKTLQQARVEAEKEALQRSLQYAGNNVAEAARALGISRLTVHRLMDKHGVATTADLERLAG